MVGRTSLALFLVHWNENVICMHKWNEIVKTVAMNGIEKRLRFNVLTDILFFMSSGDFKYQRQVDPITSAIYAWPFHQPTWVIVVFLLK